MTMRLCAMKDPQKIKRVQLSLTGHDDFVLLGLVSSDPDYKLSLKINRKLHISLKSGIPAGVATAKGDEIHFTRFTHTVPGSDSFIHLLSNRSGAESLLKKLKNVDYLLGIYDPAGNYDPESLVLKLREIDTVTAVFNIDPGNIKDKNLSYLYL